MNQTGKRNKKQKGGGGEFNKKNDVHIAESTRIKIHTLLEDFRTSNHKEYTFEANLTNTERAAVHILCRKMGLRSKSSGRGDQRRVSVFTNKAKSGTMKKEKLTCFTFSEESKEVLQDLFMRYPPDDHDIGQETVKFGGINDKLKRKKDDIFSRPDLSKDDIKKKAESLGSRVNNVPMLKQITEKRSKLPIAAFRDVITSTIDSHQVVLISGETGCGKTTQVPQYILDHMWRKGEACKIVCTQPRRISATSVAERISSERGENIGECVGYKIRLESKGGRHSSIVFCTNGVLLRVLIAKGSDRSEIVSSRREKDDISNITHIIVDEIHERDRFSDFMLAIIRDMLPSYPNLRLVLMSATLDAERFSQYFGGCPIIRVPGFTYPVKTFYLEDVLSFLKSSESNHLDCTSISATDDLESVEERKEAIDEAINLAWSTDEFAPLRELVSCERGANLQHSITGVTPLMIFSGKGEVGDLGMLLSFGADCHLRDNDGRNALEWAKHNKQDEAAEILNKHIEESITNSKEENHLLDKYFSTANSELIDVVLIEKLLRKICCDSVDGAILVFLSGWDDIKKTKEILETSNFFKDSNKFVILALHSMVPSMEQKKVFNRPPPGCRKIILSTNISETAITIDDVVYVIDCGRMKEKSYDPYNNVSTLHSSWISKASAKQREGRAGRCQPGICYHLYSKLRAASLPAFQVPEIKRMPIEELCLQVKLLDPECKIDEFLKKTLDPPVFESMRNAIIVLQDIGALTPDEKLTELGEKLGSLPVHPLTSKMLFLAILLNCLDPALTLACASDYRDPFTLPMSPFDKKKAAAAKSELASLYGGQSDQLALIAAFECWKKAKEKGQEARFCSNYYVSSGTMNMLFGMRKQLRSELHRNGFIPDDVSLCSLNAHDPGILDAVLFAGLYPMVGRLFPQKGRRALVETSGGEKVRLHPHSTNFKLSKRNDQPLLIFDEVTRGDGGLHIRNCSVIGPLPLLLLATEIVVAPSKEDDEEGDDDDDDEDGTESEDADLDENDEHVAEKHSKLDIEGEKIMSSPENTVKVVVDRWLAFETTALDVAQIYCLRERLSAATLFKVREPRKILPENFGVSMCAIASVLSYDGRSGISETLDSVEKLTSMVSATEFGQAEQGTNNKIHQPNNFLNSLIRPRNNAAHYYNGKVSASRGMVNRNGQLYYHLRQPPPSASTNHYRGRAPQNFGLPAYEAGVHGEIGPSGDSLKRRYRTHRS
ncbi:DExH-box ATP-dependent RNA helicase DExH6 isoform X2 [Apium graveolens]|uniref:DExH-box ATP-dependent RNA helicase DExH6 isoform X2 n=1 Tax=Apium graveolens TaxID=4045 RepID=UPI003D7A1C70